MLASFEGVDGLKGLESIALALAYSPDLPSLCYQLMDEFRDNRVYSTDILNLEFRYKQAA
jgi:hypothetical protein